MTLAVTGFNTTLVMELRLRLPEEEIVRINDRTSVPMVERYLLAGGLLLGKRIWDQSDEQVAEVFLANAGIPIKLCDYILAKNENARIVVIGSESGYTWSYDGAYAAAKCALHRYVETKRLEPNQQLVCIAPSIIEDAGMTTRRTDVENLLRRRTVHPKKRFLKVKEVALMVYHLLYVDEGYTTNCVIRMNGGAHT